MEPTCGPYQLLEQLGEGGAGVVYRARDLRDGQEVALKLLLRPTAKRMGRFQLEAATLVKLRHPNVVPVRDFGTAPDGRPYLALELIRGQTLQRRLDTSGPLGPTEAVELTLQLAAALSAAHAKGLLHRDVKPENVLIRASDGAAILGDFGLAKELDSQLERLTQTGTVMGTPGYLAPEQLGSSDLHTPALDVYGAGATLYAMLTGGPPVTGSTPFEAFQATLAQAPTPPSQLAPVPPALEALCLRCLAKDPAERYPDASALLDALDALDSQQPAPLSPLAPDRRHRHRRDDRLELVRPRRRGPGDFERGEPEPQRDDPAPRQRWRGAAPPGDPDAHDPRPRSARGPPRALRSGPVPA